MKVKELIEQLKDMDPELDVWLQKDPEGNGYENVYCVTDRFLIDENDDFWYLDWSASDADMKPQEWEEFKNSHSKVVMIQP